MPPTRTLDEVADAIVRMPLDEGPKDSHVSLRQATGYMDRRGEINVDALYARLSADEHLVDAWQTWVEDQRSTPNWYFRTLDSGRFEVGLFDRQGRPSNVQVFDDRARACAEYLRHEIDSTAEAIDVWSRPWRLVPEIIGWFWEEFRDARDRRRRRRLDR